MKCLVRDCPEQALTDSMATGFRAMGLCKEHHDRRTFEVADSPRVQENADLVQQAREELNQTIETAENLWDKAHGINVGLIRFRLGE